MSVCWEPATVGGASAVSTLRALSVARERSAVGLAMNSLTTTIAKVSQTVLFASMTNWLCILAGIISVFNSTFPLFQILMSVRLASITVAQSLSAKTPRGHFVVPLRSSVVAALSKMPSAPASVSTKRHLWKNPAPFPRQKCFKDSTMLKRKQP